MAVYVVRGGDGGKGEESALNGEYGIDFGLHQSVRDFPNRDALRDHLQQTWAVGIQKAAQSASQNWLFVYGIGLDDLVVLPRQQSKGLVAVGKMIGDYEYRRDYNSIGLVGPHTRRVKWRAVDIPIVNFEDFQNAFGAQRTIFQVHVDDAEERINNLVNEYLDEIADRLVKGIRQEFSGYRLDYMVANILKRGLNRLED